MAPDEVVLPHVSVGDADADGKRDVVVNFSTQDLTLLLGDGLGGFVPVAAPTFLIGSSPIDAAVGDFNLDGNPGIADTCDSAAGCLHTPDDAEPGSDGWRRGCCGRRLRSLPARSSERCRPRRVVLSEMFPDSTV